MITIETIEPELPETKAISWDKIQPGMIVFNGCENMYLVSRPYDVSGKIYLFTCINGSSLPCTYQYTEEKYNQSPWIVEIIEDCTITIQRTTAIKRKD